MGDVRALKYSTMKVILDDATPIAPPPHFTPPARSHYRAPTHPPPQTLTNPPMPHTVSPHRSWCHLACDLKNAPLHSFPSICAAMAYFSGRTGIYHNGFDPGLICLRELSRAKTAQP